jgi:glycosyltransferase involved in cell wall biosynthesis
VESVVFACAYIKRTTLEKIGLLSEDFFAYFEDSDYCIRARREGLGIVMAGNVRLLHHENTSTKANAVDFSSFFNSSRDTFITKWRTKIEEVRYESYLDWHSIVNFPSGYATSSREILLALEWDAIINEHGVKTSYRYVYGRDSPFPVDEPTHSDSYLINCIRQREFGKSDTQVVYAQGDVFTKNTGKYKVGFTMLETSGIPKEWVKQANIMDEVWVPSSFNMQVFIDCGVKKPIKIVPLGVDLNYFHPAISSRRLSDKYTFLSVFEWGERKAPEILLKAFSDEFSENEDVCLVCKANNFDQSLDIENEIAKLNLRKGGAQIIVLPNLILRGYEVPALYRSVDAFVLPTRGEGWGMPMLEAMACGLPTIATNWSAQTDFMSHENSFLIDVDRLVPAKAKCPYYDGFKWAEPSYEHLRFLMRRLAEDPVSGQHIGQKGALTAKEFSWQNTAKKIQVLLNR